ncbi:hypothetical protein [Paraburkholderia sp.]|uniref:hypothetical protein n=1 Tax=Paraburkholderia sp. TaxID=1926495 RepID=UPI0039E6422C
MSEQLWCVHIEGLNDFIAVDSEESARYEAATINAYIDNAGKDSRAALMRAVAIEWPFSAAGHARALDDDWHDLQRMSHRRQGEHGANRSGGVLADITRRVKKLLTVAHAGREDDA